MKDFKIPKLSWPIWGLTLVFALWLKSSSAYNIQLSIGNLTEHFLKYQTDDRGTKNIFTFLPYGQLSIEYPFLKQHPILISAGSALPSKGRDSNITRWPYFFNISYKFVIAHEDTNSAWSFLAGSGIFVTKIWGPGGQANLNNGLSQSNYNLPSDPTYSRNMTLHFALQKMIHENIHLEGQIFVFNPIDHLNRSFTYGLNMTYHFGALFNDQTPPNNQITKPNIKPNKKVNPHD